MYWPFLLMYTRTTSRVGKNNRYNTSLSYSFVLKFFFVFVTVCFFVEAQLLKALVWLWWSVSYMAVFVLTAIFLLPHRTITLKVICDLEIFLHWSDFLRILGDQAVNKLLHARAGRHITKLMLLWYRIIYCVRSTIRLSFILISINWRLTDEATLLFPFSLSPDFALLFCLMLSLCTCAAFVIGN